MERFIQENKVLLNLKNDREQAEHLHSEMELLFILEGQMTLHIYDAEYVLGAEDIVLINTNELHSYQTDSGTVFAQLYLVKNMFRDAGIGINSRFRCNSVAYNAQEYAQLREQMKILLIHFLYSDSGQVMNQGAGYEYLSAYFHLLEMLSVHFLVHISDANLTKVEKNEKRIQSITDYIEDNYSRAITFRDLAESLYLSEGYLSRYFAKTFHMKFSEYLRNVRLRHAMDLLLYTEDSITKIAYDTGFSSVPFFNKNFKEVYGETPSAFRKSPAGEKTSSSENENQGEMESVLEHFLNKEYVVPQEVANHHVEQAQLSALERKELPFTWNRLINIGSAADILRREVQEHLLILHSALQYSYVRFWSLFSKDMLIDIANTDGNYNFSRLDQVLDFLVENGMKPFIDLEQKEKKLHANTESVMLEEEHLSIFRTMEQCNNMLEALFRHLVRRYGREEMKTWKLEVFFCGYSVEGMDPFESYFHIYRSTYRVAKKYVPDMEIGGCGMFPEYLTDLPLRKRNFWAEWKAQAPRPDFISLMNYAYEPNEENTETFGKRSTNEEYLLYNIQMLKKELEEAKFTGTKLYITEWNLTVTDRDYLNDSCRHGAYVMKNCIDVCRDVDMLGYFNGTDCYSEYYDSSELLHGGLGLLSRDGVFKPSAFAIGFLNHLYSQEIGRGEHFILTTNGQNNYNLSAHNMMSFSYYYYMTEESHIEKDKLWRCFQDAYRQKLDLEITDVEDGEYIMKIHRVNRQGGSILDEWEKIGYFQELSRPDIKYFLRVCEPQLEIRRITATEHTIHLNLTMEPNEIMRVDIRKEM